MDLARSRAGCKDTFVQASEASYLPICRWSPIDTSSGCLGSVLQETVCTRAVGELPPASRVTSSVQLHTCVVSHANSPFPGQHKMAACM